MGTIISFIAGIGIIIGAIVTSTDKPSAFWDVSSVLVVFGGTFATLFISYELKVAMGALKLMFAAFGVHQDSHRSLKNDIGQIVHWAYVIQKNGLQGLENEISDSMRADDPFLTYGADLVVTGYTGAEIKQILEHTLEAQYTRDNAKVEALKKMGGDAPAFGMLGTLIGLVIMLGSMGTNPDAIGPAMAVALITTFYGVGSARLIFIPLATKMAARQDVTIFKNTLQMEGLVLLAERKSPRYIQDKINSFVDSKEQFSIDRDLNIISAPNE